MTPVVVVVRSNTTMIGVHPEQTIKMGLVADVICRTGNFVWLQYIPSDA